jgi:uncharacterized membrane protein (DUF373 family)
MSPSRPRSPLKQFLQDDEFFLSFLRQIERIISRLLSIAMLVVICVTLFDLFLYLGTALTDRPPEFLRRTLIEIFGFFLTVLIALEILENITAYLRNHEIQLKLVIVTSLTAVARKIIVLDLDKTRGLDLIGLGLAVLTLSISYWIVRRETH